MKLLQQVSNREQTEYSSLSVSLGFVLLHLFHVPAHRLSTVDSYYFAFSIHVSPPFTSLHPSLFLLSYIILLSRSFVCCSFRGLNVQSISTGSKQHFPAFVTFYLDFLTPHI